MEYATHVSVTTSHVSRKEIKATALGNEVASLHDGDLDELVRV